MADPSTEEEYRAEAERLALLPAEDQRNVIAMHRKDAGNPKVPKRDRELAQDRADALEKHLRRLKRKTSR